MLTPYNDQLRAIREMLVDPASEIVQEGYDLLFKLWLKNHENVDFKQELLGVAIDHSQLVTEFTNRLRKLHLSSSITNTYLRKGLETLAADIESYKSNYIPDTSKKDGQLKVETSEIVSLEKSRTLNLSPKALASILIQMLKRPRIVASSFIVIIIIIWAFYSIPQNGPVTWGRIPNVTTSYSYPKYLSVKDQNIIDIPIVNSGNAKFDGTITLVFEDPIVPITQDPGQSLAIDIDVPPHGRKTAQFNFLLAERPPENKIEFHFIISLSDGTTYQSNKERFLIAPIPYLRSTSAWLFGSAGLGALLFAMAWEKLQKSLGLK